MQLLLNIFKLHSFIYLLIQQQFLRPWACVLLCKAKEEIISVLWDSIISLTRLKMWDYLFSILQLGYVKKSQPDNRFFFFQYALERTSVSYDSIVLISFSVSSDHGDQMTVVLSCAASLSPWVSLLGRLWTKNVSKGCILYYGYSFLDILQMAFPSITVWWTEVHWNYSRHREYLL